MSRSITLDPEQRRALLDHYRKVLAASGGPDWSHDELVDDLAWSMLFFVAGQSIPYAQDYSNLGDQSERMKQRMIALFRRFGLPHEFRVPALRRQSPPGSNRKSRHGAGLCPSSPHRQPGSRCVPSPGRFAWVGARTGWTG
jgi:hypothetical protein